LLVLPYTRRSGSLGQLPGHQETAANCA